MGSPDEIAFVKGWIDAAALRERADAFRKNRYGRYLLALAEGGDGAF